MSTCIFVSVVGLLCDLVWSDPEKDLRGWGPNDRGVSFTFGADVVGKFCNRMDLDLVCRAHQVSILSHNKSTLRQDVDCHLLSTRDESS